MWHCTCLYESENNLPCTQLCFMPCQAQREILKNRNNKIMNLDNKYVIRLRQEWEQHEKIIIACDFDDTISPWKFSKEDVVDTINVIKDAQQTGAYVVIFTACDTSRYDEIKNYCINIGINVDSINQNPINMPYGNNGKVYANIFLDDRAGLDEAKEILKTCIWLQRAYKQSKKHLDDIA